LNAVKQSPSGQNENWMFSIARKTPTKTLCSLFATESHFGKLDITDQSMNGNSMA
jgi:hypothetical protein